MADVQYSLEVITVQVKEFKTLIDALKEVLTEVNIVFDHTGLKIVALEKEGTVMVHLHLFAEQFEKFHCSTPVNVAVDMSEFSKLIKVLTSGDILTLYMKSPDDDKFWIKIHSQSAGKVMKCYMVRKDFDYNPDDEDLPLDMDFGTIITMPSTEFQKMCRHYNNFADKLEIRCVGSNVYLSCKNDIDSVGIQCEYCNEAPESEVIIDNKEPSDVIQGYYNLKYLVTFSKCTDLCETFKLHIRNNYPLVLTFDVGSLGKLKMCLSPRID